MWLLYIFKDCDILKLKQLKTKNMKNTILRLAQCGGPCSGKTTGIADTADFATSLGLTVFVIPEAATLLFGGGLSKNENAQKHILKHQLRIEDTFNSIASEASLQGKKTLIIHDRSILDGMAYMKDENDFLKLLQAEGMSFELVKQNRYDVVTHLVTAAEGAPKFFSNENNKVRGESIEEAKMLDRRLQNIWVGHEHFEVIPNLNPDNSPKTFEEKIRENIAEIFGHLGFPAPLEKERKWKVEISWTLEMFKDAGVQLHKCVCFQTYLFSKNPKIERRVRKKVFEDGSSLCFYTEKEETDVAGESIERNSVIPEPRYHKLLIERDLRRKTLEKDRYAFIWKDQVFTLDRYKNPNKEYSKLEREGSRIQDVELPEFIPISGEITNLKGYRDRDAALIQ